MYGNATQQGDLVRVDTSYNTTEHDGAKTAGNSSILVRPLGEGEESYFISQVGASTTRKDDKIIKWETFGEKSADIVQKVEDSDFIVPSEWNCPAEEKCPAYPQVVTLSTNEILRGGEIKL